MSQIEVKDEVDAYEYLEQVFPNEIVKALDMAQLTIESDDRQIIEAERDVMLFALYQDATLLLKVREALSDVIREVKAGISCHAEDTAFLCLQKESTQQEQEQDLENVLGRPPIEAEMKYWRDAFSWHTADMLEEVLVETEHGTMTLTHSFEGTLSLSDGWPGGEA
jgi:hypothetical protein